jgi:hypothetical protein
VTQRTHSSREVIRVEIRKREAFYGEIIGSAHTSSYRTMETGQTTT